MRSTTTLAEKFFSKFEPVTESGCWLWNGRSHAAGYGTIIQKRGGKVSQYLAHRVSWNLHNGDIPDGMHVCHKCDVPACVNPKHLFLGTLKDNMDDMRRKMRHSFGSKAAWVLNDGAALAIRESTESNWALARRYGVDGSLISRIKNGKRWRYAGGGRIHA